MSTLTTTGPTLTTTGPTLTTTGPTPTTTGPTLTTTGPPLDTDLYYLHPSLGQCRLERCACASLSHHDRVCAIRVPQVSVLGQERGRAGQGRGELGDAQLHKQDRTSPTQRSHDRDHIIFLS
jgi:hypothetical protein